MMRKVCTCGRFVTQPGTNTCSAAHINLRTGWRWGNYDRSVYMSRFDQFIYYFTWQLSGKKKFLKSLED